MVELVLEHLVGSKQLAADKREQVQDCLLSRHRHQHEKRKGLPMVRSLADIGRKNSEKKLEKGIYSRASMCQLMAIKFGIIS